MTAKSERIFWPDFIRTVAVFAVIVLHVAAVPVIHFSSIPAEAWWWAHGFNSLVRPCIPLFVMLSGAFLLTRQNWNVSYFIRRRLMGVAVPFVAWSALYAVWDYVLNGVTTTFWDFLRHLASGMTNPTYSHLWYLPLILSLYLLVPIFQLYVLNSTLGNQIYFLALWLVATIAIPVIESQFNFPVGYSITPVFGYIGYFVLGGTLLVFLPARISILWLIAACATLISGYLVTIWGTYILTLKNADKFDEYFYSYLSPNVIAMSIAAFVLLREWGVRLQQAIPASASTRRLITLASTASFGIYLVHMIVLELLTSGILGFALGPLVFHPALAIPATSLTVFLGSFVLALLIQKMKWLRWLIP